MSTLSKRQFQVSSQPAHSDSTGDSDGYESNCRPRSYNLIKRGYEIYRRGCGWLKIKPKRWCRLVYKYCEDSWLMRYYTAKFPGWQGLAVLSIVSASITLTTNIILIIVSSNRFSPDGNNGSGILYQGRCDSANLRSSIAHVFVNIMSTLLLGGSNYMMQLLTAPTRRDVDAVHEHRDWCDIGIPSFRNSWRRVIHPFRTVAWLLLALSSAPLHLLWNATFYFTPFSYEYGAIFVSKDFLTANATIPSELYVDRLGLFWHNLTDLHLQIYDNSVFERLSPLECVQDYVQIYTQDRSDVFIVIEPPSDPNVNKTCPYGDGQEFVNDVGDRYVIQCRVDYPPDGLNGPDLAYFQQVQSMFECSNSCSQNEQCLGAMYKSDTGDCYLRSNMVSTALDSGTGSGSGAILKNPNASTITTPSSIFWADRGGYGRWPGGWACPNESNPFDCVSMVEQNPNYWDLSRALSPAIDGIDNAPQGLECFSKKEVETCSLNYSYILGSIVAFCNLVKLIVFVATYFMLRRYTQGDGAQGQGMLLITAGDAIASFLDTEDETTRGMCLADKQDFEHGIFAQRWGVILPMEWREARHRAWLRAIGVRRWLLSSISAFSLPVLSVIYLIYRSGYLRSVGLSGKFFWQSGFGKSNPNNTFGPWDNTTQVSTSGFYKAVILANLPQLYLSTVYLTTNYQLTCMFAADEYGQYATRRKRLRVSQEAKEGQKTSAFLTMPLKHSAWIMAFSTAVNWLASQSVSLIRIDIGREPGVASAGPSRTKIGNSPLAMTWFAVVGFIFASLLSFQGLRRLPPGMPVAGSCSASISAACHPTNTSPTGDDEKIRWQWGVELDAEEKDPLHLLNEASGRHVPHCTFTKHQAERPKVKVKYA